MIARLPHPKRFGGEPSCCLVCRRSAVSMGYSPNARAGTIAWVCENVTCIRAAKGVYHMPFAALNRLEKESLREAIDVAGPYLDGIGKTDLAQLAEAELDEFLERLLLGFEQAMRTRAENFEAPF